MKNFGSQQFFLFVEIKRKELIIQLNTAPLIRPKIATAPSEGPLKPKPTGVIFTPAEETQKRSNTSLNKVRRRKKYNY